MSDKQPEPDNETQKYEHDKWVYELNRETAQRDHDFELDHALRLNEATINNGNLAARSLLIINGGAAIAVLALIGRLVPSNPDDWVKISPLLESLMWFAWGVIVTAMAMMFAYFTNYCHASVSYARDRFYEHPYIRETEKSLMWRKIGIAGQAATIIFAGFAIVCFVLVIREMDETVKAFQSVAPTLSMFH